MIPVGTPAPRFSLPTQTGETFQLEYYLGRHNILLLFLPAAFTPICTTELPALSAFQQKFWDDADTVVAAITADGSPSNREWARRCNAGQLFVLADHNPPGAVSQAYGAWLAKDGVPDRSSVIIGKDGRVQYAESVGKFGKRSIPALYTMALSINGSRPAPMQSVRMQLDLPVLYITQGCPHCQAVTEILKRLRVEDRIVVRVVDQDQTAMTDLLGVEPRGLVPTMVYNGQRWTGEAQIGPQLQQIATSSSAS